MSFGGTPDCLSSLTSDSRTVNLALCSFVLALDDTGQHLCSHVPEPREAPFPLKQSLILFGRKSGAGQEHRDQSERRQSCSHQWTVKKPACCDGEKRQGARHAQGEELQPHRHQLSQNGNPVHCRQEAENVKTSRTSLVREDQYLPSV